MPISASPCATRSRTTRPAWSAKFGIGSAEQHELVLWRYQQYARALKDDSAFLRRFMPLPFDVPDAAFGKVVATLAGDEGIHAAAG